MPIVRRKSKKKTTWIYLLIDPRDKEIRYAGQATKPRSRFRSHCNCGGGNRDLLRWLCELGDAGLEPIMHIAGKITTYTGHWWIDEQIANGAERQLIRRLEKMSGSKILNIAFTSKDTFRRSKSAVR